MTPKKVLIADDDRDLVDVLAIRCREMGLDVIVADDARTAFLLICQARPDVIVLDVKMPAGSGLSVCEMLVNDEELSSIPVVMLTGKDDEETIRRCHEMCAYYVLKSHDVWERLKPLLCELLAVDPDQRKTVRPAEPVVEPEEPVDTPHGGGLRYLVDAIAGEQNEVPAELPMGNSGEWLAPGAKHEPTAEELIKAVTKESDVSEPARERDESKPLTVLYIEDDVEASNAMKVWLESLGVNMLQAYDGTQGHRMAVAEAPDLILCDIVLPEGDGNYVFRRCRENPVTEEIPVIFITGQQGHNSGRQPHGHGGDGYLVKPVSLEDLVSELSKFIPIEVPGPHEVASS